MRRSWGRSEDWPPRWNASRSADRLRRLRQQIARSAGVAAVLVWIVVLNAGTLLAAVDMAVRRLPTPVIATAAGAITVILGADALAGGYARAFADALLAAAALGAAYLLAALAPDSGMGLGDVRLAALLGMALGTLGWPAVLTRAVL